MQTALGVVSGETALSSTAKKPSYGADNPYTYVNITCENAYAYIPAIKKGELVRSLSDIRQQALPEHDNSHRFLNAPRPIRTNWGPLVTAMSRIGLDYFVLESYGMKGDLVWYDWIWDDRVVPHATRRAIVDIAGYVSVMGHEQDLVVLGVTRDPQHGRFRCFPMYNDLVEQFTCDMGSVHYRSSDAGRNYYTDQHIESARFYSPIIHVIKQNGAQGITDVPYTYKQARTRLAQIDNFMADVDSGRADRKYAVGRIRWEVRLNVQGVESQQETVQRAKQAAHDLLQCLKVATVPWQTYRGSVAEYRHMAALSACGIGRNPDRLSDSKLSVMCHLLNAVGVATDPVIKRLQSRDPRGRYRFEDTVAVNYLPPAVANVRGQPTIDPLEDIRRRVYVGPGKNDGKCKFRLTNARTGYPAKFGATPEELYLWVHRNCPQWRTQLRLL